MDVDLHDNSGIVCVYVFHYLNAHNCLFVKIIEFKDIVCCVFTLSFFNNNKFYEFDCY